MLTLEHQDVGPEWKTSEIPETSEGLFGNMSGQGGGLLLSNITSLVGLSPSVTGRTLRLSQGAPARWRRESERAGVSLH